MSDSDPQLEKGSERRYRVGSVPFVNGRPLVWAFEQPRCMVPVDVFYELPSMLPARLDSGEADAVLASSFDALATPGRRIAAGIAITSDGPVESVRLFSKVPFDEIRTLALDQSSLTSNALATILLQEVYDVRPRTERCSPNLEEMLAEFDAGVLIGDIGMRASGDGLHVLDLGKAWTAHTGLPFVWALWIGTEKLTPELSGYLTWARRLSQLGRSESLPRPLDLASETAEIIDRQIAQFAQDASWPPSEVWRYLQEVIGFDLTDRHREALRLFQTKLVGHGWIQNRSEPEMVPPAIAIELQWPEDGAPLALESGLPADAASAR